MNGLKSIIICACLYCSVITAVAQEKFCIAKNGKTATIVVDEQDWTGVIRAARDLGDDIRKVSGMPATLLNDKGNDKSSIIVGTIGKSRLISTRTPRAK